MERYHPEDVIPFILTLIITGVLVLAISTSLSAVTLAEQCGPEGLAAASAAVEEILAREGSAYRVATADGGSFLPQDRQLTRVQLRHLLDSQINACADYLGNLDQWRWRALQDQVTAEINRRAW